MRERDTTLELLVLQAQGGDERAKRLAYERAGPLVNHFASKYHIRGLDPCDLVSEAMIPLAKAIRNYRRAESSFVTFLHLCVKRHMHTLLKQRLGTTGTKETRYLWVGDIERTCFARVADTESDPAQCVPHQAEVTEDHAGVEDWMRWRASALERGAVRCVTDGLTYREASEKLTADLGKRVDEKSVDNALCRLYRKVRRDQAAGVLNTLAG